MIVFLELGGNVGDTFSFLNEAKKLIGERAGRIVAASSLYETPPWGFSSAQNFINQSIKINTKLLPYSLLKVLMQIEHELGRVRCETRYSARTLDIDILLFENQVINDPDLVIPHPRIQQRRFVLEPLIEIGADVIHPIFNLSIRDLLEICSDRSKLIRL